MKCQNCDLKEVNAVIEIGNKEFKVCSPECMDELIKKYREAHEGEGQ